MFLAFVALLSLLSLSFAAPCVDGVNNVFGWQDLSDGALPIIVRNVSAATYTSDLKPSCFDGKEPGRPSIEVPGVVRLISGEIVVKEKVDLDLYDAHFTVEKEGWFGKFTKICRNVKDGVIGTVPCRKPFCELLGPQLCTLLSNPGTYDIKQIQSEDIKIPSVNSVLLKVLKGNWRGSVVVKSAEGKELASLAIAADNDKNVVNVA